MWWWQRYIFAGVTTPVFLLKFFRESEIMICPCVQRINKRPKSKEKRNKTLQRDYRYRSLLLLRQQRTNRQSTEKIAYYFSLDKEFHTYLCHFVASYGCCGWSNLDDRLWSGPNVPPSSCLGIFFSLMTGSRRNWIGVQYLAWLCDCGLTVDSVVA